MKKIVVIALLMLAPLAVQAASSSDKIQHVKEEITRLRNELKRVNDERAALQEQYENQSWLLQMLPGGPKWMHGALESEVKHFEEELQDAENKLKQLQAQQ